MVLTLDEGKLLKDELVFPAELFETFENIYSHQWLCTRVENNSFVLDLFRQSSLLVWFCFVCYIETQNKFAVCMCAMLDATSLFQKHMFICSWNPTSYNGNRYKFNAIEQKI